MKIHKAAVKLLLSAVLIPLYFLVMLSSCAEKPTGPLVPAEYAGWETTTKVELNYPIPGHENNYRKIFINSIGENPAITTQAEKTHYDYPEGTVIIKEIYPGLTYIPGSKPAALTVMVKARNNPKSRGGWLWIVKDLASQKESIITQEFCVTCHGNANEPHPYGDGNPEGFFRDYVFFPVK